MALWSHQRSDKYRLQYQQGLSQPIINTTAFQGSSVAPTAGSELNSDNVTPHKIFIRGLDDLSTNDITSFLAEHLLSLSHLRIEWIDDTSANVVFPTPALALKALEQLTSPNHNNMTLSDWQLRAAKPYSIRPESNLEVRLALTTDQKRPRAYQASRFYMMHPDLDPREQSRRAKLNGGASDYRRRRYDHDEQRRRRRNDREQGFDASMYDDGADLPVTFQGQSAARRTSSVISSDGATSPEVQRSRRRGDYFRPRNRSASPCMEPDENIQDPAGRRRRRRTTPTRDADHRTQVPLQNSGKELFPSKPVMGTALGGGQKHELFPNKKLAANLKKELFPNRSPTVHHRRSDAFDAADATADLFANRLAFTNASVAGVATKAPSSYGRLNVDSEMNSVDEINIRGASKQDTGFTIRGIAADGTRVGVIKELFPDKTGSNSGKELFAEQLQGRGGRRNRAADMFH